MECPTARHKQSTPYSAKSPPNGFLNVAAATPSWEQVACEAQGRPTPPCLFAAVLCHTLLFLVLVGELPGGWVVGLSGGRLREGFFFFSREGRGEGGVGMGQLCGLPPPCGATPEKW